MPPRTSSSTAPCPTAPTATTSGRTAPTAPTPVYAAALAAVTVNVDTTAPIANTPIVTPANPVHGAVTITASSNDATATNELHLGTLGVRRLLAGHHESVELGVGRRRHLSDLQHRDRPGGQHLGALGGGDRHRRQHAPDRLRADAGTWRIRARRHLRPERRGGRRQRHSQRAVAALQRARRPVRAHRAPPSPTPRTGTPARGTRPRQPSARAPTSSRW